MVRETISIPQISLHSGTNIRRGDNLVLAHDVERAFTRSHGNLRVRFDGIRSFADSISL